MNTAETPFEFFTVSYLTRIGNQSAGTLAEFLKGLKPMQRCLHLSSHFPDFEQPSLSDGRFFE